MKKSVRVFKNVNDITFNENDKNIIFVYADFPRRTQLSPELKKHNEELKKMYKISGYPTVYLLNADGSVILKTGYQRGGAKKYIKHLKSAIAKAK